MRTLVTGGDGFVGEHLIDRLLEAGDRVTASCLSLPPTRDTLSTEAADAVDWKVADVLDPDALYRVVAAARPDVVYHLAGLASGSAARERPEEALRVNAGGTIHLMEAVTRAGTDFPELDPLIVVIGSGHAYGAAARGVERVDERAALQPLEPYGLSKACQEMVADAYRRERGLRTVTVRPFHLLGPGQKRGFVLPDFCAQAAAVAAGRADPLIRVGNLEVERDFADVRDATEAFQALASLEERDTAYNVCSGVGRPVSSLLDWVLDEAAIEAEVRVEPDLTRPGEPPRLVGDPSRLREATGWTGSRTLEETVRETYRWVAASGSGKSERRASEGGGER